jgi:hypothetical protein
MNSDNNYLIEHYSFTHYFMREMPPLKRLAPAAFLAACVGQGKDLVSAMRADMPALENIANGTIPSQSGWYLPISRVRGTLAVLFRHQGAQEQDPVKEAGRLLREARAYLSS